jgi:hypothetical protein
VWGLGLVQLDVLCNVPRDGRPSGACKQSLRVLTNFRASAYPLERLGLP